MSLLVRTTRRDGLSKPFSSLTSQEMLNFWEYLLNNDVNFGILNSLNMIERLQAAGGVSLFDANNELLTEINNIPIQLFFDASDRTMRIFRQALDSTSHFAHQAEYDPDFAASAQTVDNDDDDDDNTLDPSFSIWQNRWILTLTLTLTKIFSPPDTTFSPK